MEAMSTTNNGHRKKTHSSSFVFKLGHASFHKNSGRKDEKTSQKTCGVKILHRYIDR